MYTTLLATLSCVLAVVASGFEDSRELSSSGDHISEQLIVKKSTAISKWDMDFEKSLNRHRRQADEGEYFYTDYDDCVENYDDYYVQCFPEYYIYDGNIFNFSNNAAPQDNQLQDNVTFSNAEDCVDKNNSTNIVCYDEYFTVDGNVYYFDYDPLQDTNYNDTDYFNGYENRDHCEEIYDPEIIECKDDYYIYEDQIYNYTNSNTVPDTDNKNETDSNNLDAKETFEGYKNYDHCMDIYDPTTIKCFENYYSYKGDYFYFLDYDPNANEPDNSIVTDTIYSNFDHCLDTYDSTFVKCFEDHYTVNGTAFYFTEDLDGDGSGTINTDGSVSLNTTTTGSGSGLDGIISSTIPGGVLPLGVTISPDASGNLAIEIPEWLTWDEAKTTLTSPESIAFWEELFNVVEQLRSGEISSGITEILGQSLIIPDFVSVASISSIIDRASREQLQELLMRLKELKEISRRSQQSILIRIPNSVSMIPFGITTVSSDSGTTISIPNKLKWRDIKDEFPTTEDRSQWWEIFNARDTNLKSLRGKTKEIHRSIQIVKQRLRKEKAAYRATKKLERKLKLQNRKKSLKGKSKKPKSKKKQNGKIKSKKKKLKKDKKLKLQSRNLKKGRTKKRKEKTKSKTRKKIRKKLKRKGKTGIKKGKTTRRKGKKIRKKGKISPKKTLKKDKKTLKRKVKNKKKSNKKRIIKSFPKNKLARKVLKKRKKIKKQKGKISHKKTKTSKKSQSDIKKKKKKKKVTKLKKKKDNNSVNTLYDIFGKKDKNVNSAKKEKKEKKKKKKKEKKSSKKLNQKDNNKKEKKKKKKKSNKN